MKFFYKFLLFVGDSSSDEAAFHDAHEFDEHCVPPPQPQHRPNSPSLPSKSYRAPLDGSRRPDVPESSKATASPPSAIAVDLDLEELERYLAMLPSPLPYSLPPFPRFNIIYLIYFISESFAGDSAGIVRTPRHFVLPSLKFRFFRKGGERRCPGAREVPSYDSTSG